MNPHVNWHNIDTVILDMDGTLLDLAFDSYFWLQLVPQSLSENVRSALNRRISLSNRSTGPFNTR